MTAGEGETVTFELDVPLRTSHDTEGDVQRVLAQMEEAGAALAIVRLVANSPHAFRSFVLMAKSLLRDGLLPAKDREAVIMFLAARLELPYEWSEHLPMARDAGLSDAQFEALMGRYPQDAAELDEHQRLAVAIAGEISDGRVVPPELWSRACDTWGRDGAMDIILDVAWWGGFVAVIIRATGLDVMPDESTNEGS